MARAKQAGEAPQYKAVYQGVEIVPPSSEQDFIKAMKKPLNEGEDAAIRELKRMSKESKRASRNRRKLIEVIAEWERLGKTTKSLSSLDIANAIKTINKHCKKTAEMLEEGSMFKNVLSEKEYIEAIMDNSNLDEEKARQFMEQTPAFAVLEETYYLASEFDDMLTFLDALVHEASHVIDYNKALDLIDAGATDTEIRSIIKTNWEQEKRAHMSQHNFQKALGLEPHFVDQRSVNIHVEAIYEDYPYYIHR